jgi:hypothetical protein
VEPAASAAAVVVVTTISRVLTASPPPIGPAMLAYSPYTGFTPTSTADAIPSGTLAIAPGTPATASCRNVAGSGRSDLTHAGSRLTLLLLRSGGRQQLPWGCAMTGCLLCG